MKPAELREGEEPSKIIPAIRIDDASDVVLRGIRDIFYELTFGEVKEDERDTDLGVIRRTLQARSFLGLKLGGGAKLQMRKCYGAFAEEVVAFDYNPNLLSDERGYAEGQTKVQTFRQRVAGFLSEKGLLFTAPDLQR